MKTEMSTPSSAFPLMKSLKQSGFVGMVMFGLCVPIVAFRAEQNMNNELVLQSRWWLTLVFTVLAMIGSFLLSAYTHNKSQKIQDTTPSAFKKAFDTITPRLPNGHAGLERPRRLNQVD